MTAALSNIWDEERHFKRDAIRGSKMLLLAILKAQGVRPPQKRRRAYKAVATGLFERNAKVAMFELPTADYYGLCPDSLHSKTRVRRVARPRQVVMYLAHTYGNASLPEIGRHFGKDHTTVLHACRAVAANDALMADVEALRERLAA